MYNIILAIHLILAVLIIGVVLLQRNEGGGLGIGGGNSKAAARGSLDGIGKLTWALAFGLILTSLTLTIMGSRASGTSSVLDNLIDKAAVNTQPVEESQTQVPVLPSDTPSGTSSSTVPASGQ